MAENLVLYQTLPWPDVQVGNQCLEGFSGDSGMLLGLGITDLIQGSQLKWVG